MSVLVRFRVAIEVEVSWKGVDERERFTLGTGNQRKEGWRSGGQPREGRVGSEVLRGAGEARK